jgi:hypothetical protein
MTTSTDGMSSPLLATSVTCHTALQTICAALLLQARGTDVHFRLNHILPYQQAGPGAVSIFNLRNITQIPRHVIWNVQLDVGL